MASSDRDIWDRRHAEGAHAAADPPGWLSALTEDLPRVGRALDVACGSGALALFWAERGLETSAVDISPVALAQCRARAASAGLEIETTTLDLETEPLPRGPFAVVSCRSYLQRDLFGPLIDVLAPGGVLVAEIATLKNLERHARPSARFLLGEGEMLDHIRPLSLVYYHEGWLAGRCAARLVARRADDAAARLRR